MAQKRQRKETQMSSINITEQKYGHEHMKRKQREEVQNEIS
jgi:hypothetical protein